MSEAVVWMDRDGRRIDTTGAGWRAYCRAEIAEAALGNLHLVSGSHLQEVEQKHDNARIRRVFRRWAWKHVGRYVARLP